MAIGQTPIDSDDLIWLAKQLDIAFKVPFSDPDHVEHARCLQVFDMAITEKYTRPEFRAAVMAFLATKPYPTFTPADVLQANRPKIYPRSWYLERIEEDKTNIDAIGCYDLKGEKVYGWKHEVGRRLVPVQSVKVPEQPRLCDTRPHMDAETKARFDEFMAKTRRELGLDENDDPDLVGRTAIEQAFPNRGGDPLDAR